MQNLDFVQSISYMVAPVIIIIYSLYIYFESVVQNKRQRMQKAYTAYGEDMAYALDDNPYTRDKYWLRQ